MYILLSRKLIKMLMSIFLSSVLLLITSCISSMDNASKIETENLLNSVNLIYKNELIINQDITYLGEYLKGSEPITIPITIYNKSAYEIFDISIDFIDQDVGEYTYASSESENGLYPGEEGTCATKLEKNKSCVINLQFSATDSGLITQKFRVNYKNLVKEESYVFILSTQSGEAADLIFENNTSNFSLGEVDPTIEEGTSERSYQNNYIQEITIINQGELSATNISKVLSQNCKPEVDSDCPDNIFNSFSYTNIDCPETIKGGQSCKFKVIYSPKNIADTEIEKNVTYSSALRFNYQTNPNGETNSLTATFSSFSTDIKALITSSKETISFDSQITTGNRLSTTFKLKNEGRRTGYAHALHFYSSEQVSPLYTCYNEGQTYLSCYNNSSGNLATLQDFPFVFTDIDSCINDPSSPTPIAFGQLCKMEVFFQPSVNETIGATLLYSARIEYDTRFLNQNYLSPLDKNNPLENEDISFEISGSFISAAKIELTSVTQSTSEASIDITQETTDVYVASVGKVSIQNPTSESPISLDFTFTNTGETKASEVNISDLSGISLVFDQDNDLGGSDKGVNTPLTYRSIKPDTVSCKSITAGSACTLKVTFVPTARATNEILFSTLFDYIDESNPEDSYKAFQLIYQNGSKYLDANFSDISDVDTMRTVAKYKFIPVSAGILSGPTILKNFDSGKIAPEPTFMILEFKNSGTATIPYISNQGTFCVGMDDCVTSSTAQDRMLKIVSTDDATYPFSLDDYDAQHDCTDLFDWDGSHSSADERAFNSGESCVLKIVAIADNSSRNSVDTNTGHGLANAPNNLYARNDNAAKLFDINTDKPVELWEYFLGNINYSSFSGINLDYFDSDLDPSEPTYSPGLGKLNSLSSADSYQVTFQSQAKLIPTLITPYMSSILYRPNFSLSELYTNDSSTLLANIFNYSELWIYYPNGFTAATASSPESLVTPTTFTYIYKGLYSQSHLKAYFESNSTCADCEYTIHFGTFPVNSTQDLSISIANLQHVASSRGGDISALNFTSDSNNYLNIDTSLSDLSGRITRNKSKTISLQFTPLTSGSSVAYLEYTYSTGIDENIANSNSERTIKIQLIIDAIEDPPSLDFSYRSFQVDEAADSNDPPTEALITDCNGNSEACPIKSSKLDESMDSSNPAENLDLSIVRVEVLDDNSLYVKKRLYIENSSTTNTMNDFSYFKRASTTSSTKSNLTLLSVGVESSGTCETYNSLAPGQSCYIDFSYRATTLSTALTIYYTFTYKINTYQYYNQNIELNLIPLDAGQIFPCEDFIDCEDDSSLTARNILINSDGSTANAFEISIPETKYFTENYSISKELTLANQSTELRVSLLKAWHEFLANQDNTNAETLMGQEYTDIDDIPIDLHPQPSYFTSFEGDNYIPIYTRFAFGGGSTLTLKATDTCFYGEYAVESGLNYDDLEPEDRGFVATENAQEECRVIATLNVSIDYIAQNITNASNFDKINPNTIELPYYTYKRNNSSLLLIYFSLKVEPDIAMTTNTSESPFFSNIEVYSDQTASLNFKDSTPASQSAGEISGYRIYYSQSPTDFQNDLYYKSGSSVSYLTQDINSGNTPNLIDDTILEESMSAYYFKVMAIRSNGDYNSGAFHDLPNGSYLSDIKISYNDTTNPSLLRVVVPPQDYSYIHESGAMVKSNFEKDRGSINPVSYEGAISTCTSLPSVNYFDNGSTIASYKLINKTIWEYLRINDYASSYEDELQVLGVPHWIYTEENYYISNIFSSYDGYKSNSQSQSFPDTNEFYFRCSDGCDADKIIAGGFWETTLYDSTSYVGESLTLGQARCYLDVSN